MIVDTLLLLLLLHSRRVHVESATCRCLFAPRCTITTKVYRSDTGLKAAFHDTDTDILHLLADTSDTCDIPARMSVSWNAALTQRGNLFVGSHSN